MDLAFGGEAAEGKQLNRDHTASYGVRPNPGKYNYFCLLTRRFTTTMEKFVCAYLWQNAGFW